MTTVIAHIGAFKTGTSYLQSVLAHGQAALAAQGVLWPTCSRQAQVAAARALLKMRPGRLSDWGLLADEVNTWPGDRALISLEALSLVGPEGIAYARQSLAGHRFQVVLTARDLGRVVPAQWQESVQNGKTWPYRDYVAALVGDDPTEPASRHFWSKHAWADILRRWSAIDDGAEVVVVTVPPAGTASDALWLRFSQAVGLVADDFDADVRVNESLGAASAEVLRYVSAAKQQTSSPNGRRKAVKESLALGVLSGRKTQEPRLVLPTEYQDWAVQRSQEMVEQLRTLGVRVVGDLADLIPQFQPPRADETDDPSTLAPELLLESAGAGLLGLVERLEEASGRG